VYNVADVFTDPHFKSRDMLTQIDDPELRKLTVHNAVTKLSRINGRIRFTRRDKGSDNQEISNGELGIELDKVERLKKKCAI